ncbi:Lar family restriction alleviation protein [Cupriavidus respiraculi]|uniref:Restriction alleviation protein, Lar family n=1 Tax=Cupriavidus respiraculi TaxID=195930 RepID=A0ABN7YIN5_9BURK|nr:Lar family restriction alleviation protein [Cupriavidus respiraculi]CAG9173228.1 hypothetical protein LMG21510_02192 [Cupriavidus respiraculi]
MATDLKPCPFCGSDEITVGSFASAEFERHYVKCEECDCAAQGHDCEADAIAAWNRRAAPADKQGGGLMLHASDVDFLAERFRRLFDACGYPLPKFADNGVALIEIAGSCIGGVLANAEMLARVAPSVPEATVYAECRECSNCLHIGINDAHNEDASCSNCDWTGPSPKEDVCPGCAQTGTMGAACPKCSSAYRLLCDTNIAAPQPSEQQADCKCRRLGGWTGTHHPLCDSAEQPAEEARGYEFKPSRHDKGAVIWAVATMLRKWSALGDNLAAHDDFTTAMAQTMIEYDSVAKTAEEARGVDAVKALTRLIDAVENAHSDLFAQCASNPIRNAWGKEVSVAKLNEAAELALSLRAALAASRKGASV